MNRKRNLVVVAVVPRACFGVLAVSERALERTAAAQAKDMVQAPKFEVDPTLPEAAAQSLVLGQAIGVGVDAQDHIWIVHRQDSLGANEAGADQNPPTAIAAAGGAAGPRVRSGRATCCGTGAGRARATTGRTRTTASRSITRATCGSAATSAPTRTS